ncbi:MAG: hypothetical protein B6D61_03255, partial [Bacteroidetes bacterium 4484_249]
MKKTNLLVVTLFITFLLSGTLYSQKQNNQIKLKNGQAEKVDTRIDNMGYWREMAEKGLVEVAQPIPVAPAIYTGSEINAKSIKGGKEDSPDVPVTDLTNVTESENSGFINPADNEFLLNSNNSTGIPASNMYGANYFFSGDAGLTWGGSEQGAGGPNSGDPTTAINLEGSRMYVGYITSGYGQGVAYSTNGGNSFTSVTVAGGGFILDKNHLWIDNSPVSPYEGNLYNAWTNMQGGANNNEIELYRSSDGGLNWTNSGNLSSAVNAGSHNQGVNVQTGPDGEVYVCWVIYDSWPSDETAIGFTKSTDGGATFSNATRIISNIRGIRTSGISKNMRVNSFPAMAVDISGGQYNGSIYITWTNIGVPGINTGSDIDVYMIRSQDEGDTWSTPVKVNQDPSGQGKEHYFPWITCDPETGILSAIFYDDRNVSSSQCEVFCANSFDAGETWEDFKVSDVSFTPSPIPGLADSYMGDYLSITARGSMVYPVWTDTRNGHMTYVSPYVTNNLPKPTDLLVSLEDNTGETDLIWQYDETKDFLFFNIYRDGDLLGTTTDTVYSDVLPGYGIYLYSVTAMHDDGESVASAYSIQWGDAHIAVNPMAVVENLTVGASSTIIMTIENIGELELTYTISPEITSDKDSKDYCAASGGCDEYISNVEFGDISNASSCDGYADYTSMSTLVNMGETYDITVTNGTVYSSDDLGVWIDWNQDEDFDDAGENVVCESGNGGQGTYPITVPSTATSGETRMRIRIKYSGSDCGDPCGTTSYGEVEDYSVYVLGWLMVDPLGGNALPGDTDNINIALDAADLTEGVYTANLNITTNDPDNLTMVIPVTLNVGEDIPEANAYADPAEICEGESAQLFADATGGSGSYTFSWTSDPPGFTSTEQNPEVNPTISTSYIVNVFDGVFTVIDTAIVSVTQLPGICETPTGETVLCQATQGSTYETLGTANADSYIWSLSPEEAGEVSGSEETAIVNWDVDYSGEAIITVAGVNDCGNGVSSDGLTVTVNPLPDVTFELVKDSVCIYNEPIELSSGLPEGGVYSGTAVENGFFDPATADYGEHTITYTFIGENGCENYQEDVIFVGECLGINKNVDGIQIEIYPNPSNGLFTVELNSISTRT